MANAEEYKRWESSIKKIRVKTPRRYGVLLMGVILGFLAVGNLALYAEVSEATEQYNEVMTQNENLREELGKVKFEYIQLKDNYSLVVGIAVQLENAYRTIQGILTVEVSPAGLKLVQIGNVVTSLENLVLEIPIENLPIVPLEE